MVDQVGGAEWRRWLDDAGVARFRFEHDGIAFTGRREARRGGTYWYAYRRSGGRLNKVYLGRTEELDLARLRATAGRLAGRLATSPERRLNLPMPASRLIGREAELATICRLLRCGEARLVTLTGPGGVGKTRLALEAAERLTNARPRTRLAFPDGACFVDLSGLAEPGQVVPAIATALGVPDNGSGPLFDRLRRALTGARILLIVDNFEHVLTAAPALAELLTGCSGLGVLATSRAPLRLRWEHELAVPPLVVPTVGDDNADALARVEAVELFADRASAIDAGFALTRDNAIWVAQVCTQLDGLPLAIELAAAHVRELSEPVHGRPGEARAAWLGMLSDGPGDLPARQRSLRDAIGWSYELLRPAERRLFRRMSVFVGGATVDAARQVCQPEAAPEDDLPLLDGLLAKSLLRWVGGGETGRLGMLETIREFGLERLGELHELPELRQDHAAWVRGLVEEIEPRLFGPEQAVWLERLESELGNVHAALRWSIERADAETAQRIASAIWRFWEVRGGLAEGSRWLRLALACPGLVRPAIRAKALDYAGALAWHRLDLDEATTLLTEALAISHRIGAEGTIAKATYHLGLVAASAGEEARARGLFEEALALGAVDGPRRYLIVNGLASLALEALEYARSRALYEEVVAGAQRGGDGWMEAHAMRQLARLARRRRDHAAALDHCRAALARFQRLNGTWGIAACLEVLAAVLCERGADADGVELFAAAEALRVRIDRPRQPSRYDEYEPVLAAARARLGAADAGIWAAGQRLSVDEAASRAAAFLASRPEVDLAARLTAREHEVAMLVAAGATNRAVADRLTITVRTAESHVSSALSKLGLSSRSQLAAWAVRRGLVAPRANHQHSA